MTITGALFFLGAMLLGAIFAFVYGMIVGIDRATSSWSTVGMIGVDSGLCWVGDPCYVLHKLNKDTGHSWADFCEKIKNRAWLQFKYDEGHDGLGVAVSTGCGDGVYPVEVRRRGGRILAVRVVFDDKPFW